MLRRRRTRAPPVGGLLRHDGGVCGRRRLGDLLRCEPPLLRAPRRRQVGEREDARPAGTTGNGFTSAPACGNAGLAIQGSAFNCLSALACSRAHCTAVGEYLAGGGEANLVERYSNGAWSRRKGPADTSPYGVARPMATECVAVGSPGASRLAHDRWREMAVPSPRGSTETALLAVACTSATWCMTVGFYTANVGDKPVVRNLAAVWRKSRWRLVAAPDPYRTDSELNGISCRSPVDCIAVGSSSPSSGWSFTTAER